MTARRILARADREARRAGSVWLAYLWPLLLGGAAAGLTAWRPTAAFALLLGLGGAALVVLGGPWALFWRDDAPALARLPIGGRVHLALGTLTSARRALRLLCATVVASVPLWADHAGAAARALALSTAALAAAVFIGPPAALIGGALLAQPHRRRAGSASFGSELAAGPPPTQLLPLIPSITCAMLLAATVAAVPWVTTSGKAPLGVPYTWAPFAALVLLAGATSAAARALAPTWYRRAWLAIVALERARPIWIERTGPGPLEAAWGRIMTSAATLTLYRKDITCMRRRFPAGYALAGLGMVALLGLGIWPSADIATGLVTEGLPPVLLVAAGATALQVVLVMRLWRPPVEHLRLLHMLPLRRTEIRRSKAAYLTLRLLFCVIAPSIPALVRAPESGIEVMGMPIMWVGLGALLISGWLIGLWVGVRSGVSSRTFG